MARRNKYQRKLEELIRKQEPLVAKAFFEAIREINDNVRLAAIVERLEAGDVAGALRAFNLDTAAFRSLERAINEAFEQAGRTTVAAMPPLRGPEGGRIVVRFDIRNDRAELLLREASSRAVTRILEDQRAALRQKLSEGLTAGKNPRSTALEIIGRVNSATGRREGGIIGLTSTQERAVAKARAELSSIDTLSDYLSRGRRDKRFDRTIARAIKEGKLPDAATRERIIGKYSDSLLQLRGETVARTETLSAINSAQIEAWKQVSDTGAIPLSDLRQVWVATSDARTRDSHREMDGEEIMIGGTFSNGLLYPGDPSGAPEEIINCRCTMITRVVESSAP